MEPALIPILVAAVGSSVTSVSHVPMPPSYQPNILLIVLDDVGPDRLAMYRETFAPPHQLPDPNLDDPTTPNDPTDTLYEDPPYCDSWDEPFPFPRTPVLDKLASGDFFSDPDNNPLYGLQGGGIRFDRAYNAPLCNPARACMLTGRYSFRTGIGVVGDGLPNNAPWQRLSPDEVILPELLRKGFTGPPGYQTLLKKYRCGAFGKWHLTGLPVFDTGDPMLVLASDFLHPVSPDWFQHFSGMMENVGTNRVNLGDHFRWTKVTSVPGSYSLTRYDVGTPLPWEFSSSVAAPTPVLETEFTETTFHPSVTRADAVAWIGAQAQPFFAYVAFNTPHFPFQVPPESTLSEATWNVLADSNNCSGPFCAGRLSTQGTGCGDDTCSLPDSPETLCQVLRTKLFFNAMMESVDTEIGRLIAGIPQAKLEKTIVIVIGDNGSPGAIIEGAYHPANHGKTTLFELGVRVPLIVAGFLAPLGGDSCSKDVHGVDLWRTIRDISGANEGFADPGQAVRDSISFAPFIADPDSAVVLRDSVFCQNFVKPGPFAPTVRGPYPAGTSVTNPDCAEPYLFPASGHGRSVMKVINGSRYKLIATRNKNGVEEEPDCTTDTPPEYDYRMFNLENDPMELTDLVPFLYGQPESPGLLAKFGELRDLLTQVSGY